jgi:NADH-quinone oxidoreductase subunit C
MDHLQGAIDALHSRLGQGLVGRELFREQTCLELAPQALPIAARALRDEWAFDLLAGLTASDAWPTEPRFSLIYVLYSIAHNVFLRLRVRLPGTTPEVDSLESIYPAANWHEREIFDMFGVSFRGHSDLRRILLPYEWVGHPLRKDHPLGYEEVQFSFNFDEIDKRKPYARE